MNRTSEVGGAQRAEAGEFAGADGVALEAGLLVEQSLREVDGLAAEVDQGESASQAGDGGLDRRIGVEVVGGAAASGGGFPGGDVAGERKEVPEEEGGVGLGRCLPVRVGRGLPQTCGELEAGESRGDGLAVERLGDLFSERYALDHARPAPPTTAAVRVPSSGPRACASPPRRPVCGRESWRSAPGRAPVDRSPTRSPTPDAPTSARNR